jgi:hypothetical protein
MESNKEGPVERERTREMRTNNEIVHVLAMVLVLRNHAQSVILCADELLIPPNPFGSFSFLP